MKQLRFVLAAAVCVAVLAPALSHAQVGNPFDHLKCYKIKDPQAKLKYTADLVPLQKPPFNVEPGCVISVPAKLFCIPVEKTNVQPSPPGAVNGTNAQDYLLYKVKCPKVAGTVVIKGGMPLPVRDQFGARTILVGVHQLLLVPAFKQGSLCHNQANPGTPPVCGGDCTSPNQKCVLNPAGTDCACEVPCGLNAVGLCGGECPLPNQTCDFTTLSSGVVECGCHPFGGCFPDPATGQCGGPCPSADERCVNDASTGSCQCEKPCGATGLRQCGGLCPTPAEACVVMPNDAGCVCQPTQPQPCGMTGTQCAGTCPNNEVCVAGGPVPGPGCVCGPISQ
jgi:hypothetical protein